MRTALDEAAQEHGLAGAREWVVLSALSAESRQTQLSLAQSLGLDRRARIPELTEAAGESRPR